MLNQISLDTPAPVVGKDTLFTFISIQLGIQVKIIRIAMQHRAGNRFHFPAFSLKTSCPYRLARCGAEVVTLVGIPLLGFALSCKFNIL